MAAARLRAGEGWCSLASRSLTKAAGGLDDANRKSLIHYDVASANGSDQRFLNNSLIEVVRGGDLANQILCRPRALSKLRHDGRGRHLEVTQILGKLNDGGALPNASGH